MFPLAAVRGAGEMARGREVIAEGVVLSGQWGRPRLREELTALIRYSNSSYYHVNVVLDYQTTYLANNRQIEWPLKVLLIYV